jgi:cyclopropane-fatty-acyl-phospholipid synthase
MIQDMVNANLSDFFTYQGASAEAIQHHYDVSNEFYKLWLDQTQTYSCALWKDDEKFEDLETAQLRKLAYHTAQAKAGGAKRVLEIGCGWGSLLEHLTKVDGVEKAIGLTLSQAQLEHINLLDNPQISVNLENWFDHSPEMPYDSIISIAAFEAFAKPDLTDSEKIEAYSLFFQQCHQWLKPGGVMSLQTIAFGNIRPEKISPFIYQDVFPESNLPYLKDLILASESLFEITVLQNDRQGYVKTLKSWLKKLKLNRLSAVNLVGEEIVDRYEKYLQHSIFGFASGSLNLLRITLNRIDHPCRL